MKKIHWFTSMDAQLKENSEYTLNQPDLVRQIYKVLRLEAGEFIVIKTAESTFECTIQEIHKTEIKIMVGNTIKSLSTIKELNLFFCIPKKDKFEFILEKCTEIGVTNFYPVISERTIKTNINKERSFKIIQEASEQAQRTDTPTLHEPETLEHIIQTYKPVVFDVEGEQFEYAKGKEIKNFLIGPEGGFSGHEISMFKNANLNRYKIGHTILKTETAAVVISGILLQ